MAQHEFKSWDEYTEEAAHDPFQLPRKGAETIFIPAPTGAALIQWARAYRSGDAEAMLITLCGEQWKDVEPLIAKAGHRAFENLITDMMLFFDLAEDVVLVAPNGAKVVERDPRKVRKLLSQGYRAEGEAGSRT